MEAMDDFDPGDYTTVPRLDVAGLIALGRQLLAVAPADLPKPTESCRKQLAAVLKQSEASYQKAQAVDPASAKRPIDVSTDNAWCCVKTRLDPYSWVDEARSPDAKRGKALLRKLFPTGLAFTQLEYGAQWVEASWRMKLIAEEELEPELRRLCGDLFIDELYHWHKQYGAMVGVVRVAGRAAEKVARPNLNEVRRSLIQAVLSWQLQLVALHLAAHPTARAALRPTDDYRSKVATNPSSGPAPSPEQPAPSP